MMRLILNFHRDVDTDEAAQQAQHVAEMLEESYTSGELRDDTGRVGWWETSDEGCD